MSSTPNEPDGIIKAVAQTGTCVVVCGTTHVGTTTLIRNVLRKQGRA